MTDLRLTILASVLTVLVGLALLRIVGPVAGGVTVVALLRLVGTYRSRKRQRRRDLVASIRAEDPALRQELLEAIESTSDRRAVADALQRDGDVVREGRIERFSYPGSFQRNLRRRYWRSWLLAAAFLGLAAILPSLTATFRIALLAAGCYFTYRIVRVSSWQRLLTTCIEISPSGICAVGPDGARFTIAFVSPVKVHELSDGDVVVIAPDGRRWILVSRHVVGFNRLTELVRRYGVASPNQV